MDYCAVLGRQTGLATAELQALLPAATLQPISGGVVSSSEIVANRFGGIVKAGQVLARTSSNSWEQALSVAVESLTQRPFAGKLKLGVSIYGTDVSPKKITAATLAEKKKIKAAGLSVRLIPNRTQELNAAQVLYNKLTHQNGCELLIFVQPDSCIVAQTTSVQDVDAYNFRDSQKPRRDAENGMMPPKLAKTMLNLASVGPNDTVLDPFCGSGTVLIEALLLGASVYGSDLATKQVEDTSTNLSWAIQNLNIQPMQVKDISQADATSMSPPADLTAIVCETYLGPPLDHTPTEQELVAITPELNRLHQKFFENCARQFASGTKFCIAVPAWPTKSGIKTLPVVDHLTDMGYNFTSFSPSSDDAFYYRANQFVARQILSMQLLRK